MGTFTYTAPVDQAVFFNDFASDSFELLSFSGTQAVWENGDYRVTLSGSSFTGAAGATPDAPNFTGAVSGFKLEYIDLSSGTPTPRTEISGSGLALNLADLSLLMQDPFNFFFEVPVFAFSGNDVLNGTATGDQMDGQGGDDVLNGGDGDDFLQGDGFATPLGAEGNDTLNGGNGNDFLDGGAGLDRLVGGAGNDSYFIDTVGDVIVEAAGGGSFDRIYATMSELFTTYTMAAEVESIDVDLSGAFGASLVVTVNGTAAANKMVVVNATDGFDGGLPPSRVVLNGGGGNDRLAGGSGADTLDGGTGSDVMLGGTGNDTYVVDATTDRVLEAVGFSRAPDLGDTVSYRVASGGLNVSLGGTVTGITADVVYSEIEHLSLGLAASTQAYSGIGNTANNTLTGNNGANRLYGLNGNDRLTAGGGNDTLDGGAGNDTLEGGAGQDRYVLASGGNDVLIFRSVAESAVGATRDVVTGFTAGDKIDLRAIDANTALANDQAFTFIGTAAFTAAGQARFAGGLLQLSNDADTVAEFELLLSGVASVVASDFLL